MSKPFKIFLVVALLATLGFLLGKVLLKPAGQTATRAFNPETEAETVAPTVVQPEPFAEAVRNATRAAEQTQTAQTPEEWAEVGVQWDTAMQFMMKVPEVHEQYAIAQDRIPTYQANRDYAFTNAGLLEP